MQQILHWQLKSDVWWGGAQTPYTEREALHSSKVGPVYLKMHMARCSGANTQHALD
jgi:hypothetical protein